MTMPREYNWEEIIKQYESSGLTVRDFCAKEGVPNTGFYNARKRLGKITRSRVSKGREFVELSASSQQDELTENRRSIELALPHGIVLRVF